MTVFVTSTTSHNQLLEFAGLWALEGQKSISGILYVNGVPKRMYVKIEDGKLVNEKTTSGFNDQDIIAKEELHLDGSRYETITPSNRKKVVSIKLLNEGRFTQTTILYNANDSTKIDSKIIDEWSKISPGKIQLLRRNENMLNGEIWESKSDYAKID